MKTHVSYFPLRPNPILTGQGQTWKSWISYKAKFLVSTLLLPLPAWRENENVVGSNKNWMHGKARLDQPNCTEIKRLQNWMFWCSFQRRTRLGCGKLIRIGEIWNLMTANDWLGTLTRLALGVHVELVVGGSGSAAWPWHVQWDHQFQKKHGSRPLLDYTGYHTVHTCVHTGHIALFKSVYGFLYF